MRLPRATVLARWTAAALTGGGGMFLLARVMANETNWIAVFGKSLFGLTGLITGVLLISPECVGWVLAPFNGLLDRNLLPSESVPPPADYTLARLYGGQLRYEEACEEYAKIVRYHPEQITACLEGIEAARRAGNDPQARKFYRAARRVLRTVDQRRLLENVYALRYALPEPTEEEKPATEEPASEEEGPVTPAE